MKSNFIKLLDYNEAVFEAAYSAENLYVNNQLQLVPTALRIFTEGIIKDILNVGSSDQRNLLDLIKFFEREYHGKYRVVESAHKLRTTGNAASHFEPLKISEQNLRGLFNNAVRVANFYLLSYRKLDTDPIRFCKSNLPEPISDISKDKEIESLKNQVKSFSANEDALKKHQKTQNELTLELLIYKKDKDHAEKSVLEWNKEKKKIEDRHRNLKTEHKKEKKELMLKNRLQLEEKEANFSNQLKRLSLELTKTKEQHKHSLVDEDLLKQIKIQEKKENKLERAHKREVREMHTQQEDLNKKSEQRFNKERAIFLKNMAVIMRDLDKVKEQRDIESNRASMFEEKIAENNAKQKEHSQERKRLIMAIKLDVRNDKHLKSPNKTKHLDKRQRELIQITTGHHYLSAPPGAGKTLILTSRLERAVKSLKDSDIVCLTFTTRAAKEMQSRAEPVLGPRKPFIGNFHTFCLDLLKRDGTISLKQRNVNVIPNLFRDEFFELSINKIRSKKIMEVKLETLPHVVISLIDNYKKEYGDDIIIEKNIRFDKYLFFKAYPYLLLAEKQFDKKLNTFAKYNLKPILRKLLIGCHQHFFGKGNPFDYFASAGVLWQVHSCFREMKDKAETVDFDDILCNGLSSLAKTPQQRIFVQIDEVQDLNAIQWRIIDALVKPTTNLFAVGDAEQSIYGFLGANLESLSNKIVNFKKHSLEKNYRSNSDIISLLNSYRKNTWNLAGIVAEDIVNTPNSTMLFAYETRDEELNRTCKAISLILKDSSRDIGVLLPVNSKVDEYCDYLDRKNLNYFRVSATDLMQSTIVQDWFSLIRAHQGSASRIDWYKLVHRFSQTKRPIGNKPTVSIKESITFVDSLFENGISVSDIIAEKPNKESAFDYRLKRLVNSWRQDTVVIFNTETTGIDLENDQIAHLLAIEVKEGIVSRIFDRYINIDLPEDNLILYTNTENKTIVHEDTRKIIATAQKTKDVFTSFFAFVGESPLIEQPITHNMTLLLYPSIYYQIESHTN